MVELIIKQRKCFYLQLSTIRNYISTLIICTSLQNLMKLVQKYGLRKIKIWQCIAENQCFKLSQSIGSQREYQNLLKVYPASKFFDMANSKSLTHVHSGGI